MGEDYGNILKQMQQQGQYVPVKSEGSYPTLPSVESISKRIVETKHLLSLLEDVHAILVQHPDLERLIGTLRKLGQL